MPDVKRILVVLNGRLTPTCNYDGVYGLELEGVSVEKALYDAATALPEHDEALWRWRTFIEATLRLDATITYEPEKDPLAATKANIARARAKAQQ